MKATLEFDMDEEGDRESHRLAVDSGKWYSVAWEFDQWLRSQVKHGGREDLVPVRDEFWRVMNEVGVEFE